MQRRCKIVCTMGPAVATDEAVKQLIAAGMDCARLNFSHGTHAAHAETAARIRAAAKDARRHIAILADLCGPKMRVGRFADNSVELVPDTRFVLTSREVIGSTKEVSITYKTLPQEVSKGDVILLDDGLLKLRVDEVHDQDIHCIVEVGGELSNNKGMNVPGATLNAPALTDKDRTDLAFAVETLGVDYVALSFVRRPEDVLEARALARDVPLIAKIEKPEAIDCLEAIIDAADGAMIARGDLGVEVGPEKVPLIQKRIINEVKERGKVVITATQMLDSMIRNPRPTRAEAADVANAVLDGTDAVMLSGESASGKYPIESVRMMTAIITEVESEWIGAADREAKDPQHVGQWGFATAAARAAAFLSFVLPLRAIVVFTSDGRSAGLLSGHRPRAMIVGVADNARLANRMALEWGVVPKVRATQSEDLADVLKVSIDLVTEDKLCASGDAFALVAGWPVSGHTNTVKLHRLA